MPKNNFYKGTTMSYLLRNTRRANKKINISIHELPVFDEIILVGSGKGVVSLQSINKINWKDGFFRKDIGWKAIKNS